MEFLKNKIILNILKITLGFLFIIASIGKIISPEKFLNDVNSYALLPFFIVPLFAYILPWIEFFCGLLLILDIYVKSVSLIINGLLIMFLGAIIIDVYRGIDISCGCFDFLIPEQHIGIVTISRDLVMLTIGVILMFFDENKVNFYGLIKKDKKSINNKKKIKKGAVPKGYGKSKYIRKREKAEK